MIQKCGDVNAIGKYNLDLDGDVIFGSIKCHILPCPLENWTHNLTTVNTAAFFEKFKTVQYLKSFGSFPVV